MALQQYKEAAQTAVIIAREAQFAGSNLLLSCGQKEQYNKL